MTPKLIPLADVFDLVEALDICAKGNEAPFVCRSCDSDQIMSHYIGGKFSGHICGDCRQKVEFKSIEQIATEALSAFRAKHGAE